MSLASIAAAFDGSSRGSPPEVKPAIDPSTCRASPHHAPCQADAWSRRPPTLTDGWTLGHEAIRAEISKMEAVLHRLGERRLREWETRALKEWWRGHLNHVRSHHANEDAITRPFMRTRIALPAALETLRADARYAQLSMLDDVIHAAFDDLEPGSSAAPLLRAWRRYGALMFRHLLEEERTALPLLRAYFAPREVTPVVQKIFGSASKLTLGSFVHHIPGGKRGVMAFMRQEGIPTLAWYLALKGARATYRAEMESKLEALLRGTHSWIGEPKSARRLGSKMARERKKRAIHKDQLAMCMSLRPTGLDIDPSVASDAKRGSAGR